MTLLYRAYGSGKEDSPLCDVPGFENVRMKLLRHVSFVDCPVCIISISFNLLLLPSHSVYSLYNITIPTPFITNY